MIISILYIIFAMIREQEGTISAGFLILETICLCAIILSIKFAMGSC